MPQHPSCIPSYKHDALFLPVLADAHAFFSLDAFVAIPDQIWFEGTDELVDAVTPVVLIVVELLFEPAEESLGYRRSCK